MSGVRRRRALDVSTGVGAAYAAKLLADVGWDVVKVEPPDGDPLRRQQSRWGGGAGGAFAFVNQGKRIVVAADGLLASLARAADVVVGDFSPAGLAAAGLPADAYQALAPQQATVSVTPFGLKGPKADWLASDLVVQAASGALFLTGEWDQQPQQMAPYQGALWGGLAGGCATFIALRAAEAAGERRLVDVSMVESLATGTSAFVSAYVYQGEVTRREQRIKAGLRMVPAADRFVYCAPGAVASMRMDGIAVLLDEPLLAEERFQTAEGRMQHWDEFVALFVPPFRRKTAQEWFEAAEKMHMTFALVQTIDDLFTCPQLTAREFLHEQAGPGGAAIRMPGRPFRFEGGPEPSTLPVPFTPGLHTREVIDAWLA